MAVLRQSRFQEAAQFFTTFAVDVEEGHTLAEVLKPDYWAHVAQFLKPMDELVIRAEDGSFYARAIVLNSGSTWAQIDPYLMKEFHAQKVEAGAANPDYEVKWKGPHAKFVFIRTSDKQVIQGGFPRREDAEREMRDYIRTIAPRPKAA